MMEKVLADDDDDDEKSFVFNSIRSRHMMSFNMPGFILLIKLHIVSCSGVY